MASITQKRLSEINARCKNGFSFHIRGFMAGGRKQLIKTITLEENEKVAEVELYWMEEVIYQKSPHGCNVPHRTGNLIPELRVSVRRKSKHSQTWVSEGFGNRYEFKECPSTKKMTNKLCELTEQVTDELICSLLPDEECQEFKALANLK